MSSVTEIIAWLIGLPDWLLYSALGIAAAVENVVPPIPADVMVLAGAIVAGAGGADAATLFLAVWGGNVLSALLVYGAGRRYGPRFFDGRIGAFLLAPRQIEALARAYARFGVPIIFFSRFLPVFRPVVPAFAGLTRVGFFRTAIPVALASGIWYGFLVYLGSIAGSNWRRVVALSADLGGWLGAVAAVLLAAVAVWWWRTRAHGTGTEAG